MSDYSNRDEWSDEMIIGEYVTTRLALNGTWIPSLYDNWINKSKELYAEILRRMDATRCRWNTPIKTSWINFGKRTRRCGER